MAGLIGSIVGSLGTPAATGSAAITDNGEGYDFAIGGLGFRLAITDERKYERATAQFRKEQYDASDSPGDQSLLGYWTRGQLSFHKGAGQRYAELGEDTDTRYWEGVGANPFIKGEVSLYPAWANASASSFSGIIDCQPVGSTKLAALNDGRVTWGLPASLGTDYHPTLGASRGVNSIASGGGNIYAAMSDKKIDRIGLTLTYPQVYSQDFESSADSWTSSAVWGYHEVATVTQDNTAAFAGTGSLKVTWPVSGTNDVSNAHRVLTGLVAGRAYTVVANVYAATGTGANIRGWVEGVGVFGSGVPDTTWTELSYTFTATGTTHNVGYSNENLGAATSVTRIDKVRIYEGTRTGYDSGTTPIDTIYSHTDPVLEVHYVKDRLFVMDSLGAWYQLAPNPTAALPVAIASADKVFTAANEGTWSVCDTPGPVLLGNGNRIFAVTQNVDGLFPTLTSPIQVADLPIGESVVAMKHYLGFVVLVTTKGVRIAILDGSNFTYGPRLVEWSVDVYHTGVARAGESVYVAADSRIIEINLASQIGQGLEFGWAELPSPFSAATSHGVSQVSGKLVAWGGALLQIQQDTSVATGYLETPFHRFGTLEPKKFHTVKVRATGTAGSITISKVLPDGTVVSLYTMPVTGGEADVTLRADEPLDRLALRFDLNAAGGVSPKLVSYQLRALPAPIRQRMIRVPLALHDVERRGTTRAAGRTGSAWERLRELETLEAQSGIVTYQDFRTGESGQCYIEQVAHEGDTPPGRQGNGFGGIAFVTLRTL